MNTNVIKITENISKEINIQMLVQKVNYFRQLINNSVFKNFLIVNNNARLFKIFDVLYSIAVFNNKEKEELTLYFGFLSPQNFILREEDEVLKELNTFFNNFNINYIDEEECLKLLKFLDQYNFEKLTNLILEVYSNKLFRLVSFRENSNDLGTSISIIGSLYKDKQCLHFSEEKFVSSKIGLFKFEISIINDKKSLDIYVFNNNSGFVILNTFDQFMIEEACLKMDSDLSKDEELFLMYLEAVSFLVNCFK